MFSIPLNNFVHFDLITYTPSTLAAVDADSPPVFSVFEDDTDTPLLSAVAMTKRTSLTGNYRGQFQPVVADNFTVGSWYSVICSAVVSGVTRKVVVLHFRLAPAEDQTAMQKVDVGAFGGLTVTGRDIGASVLISPGTGVGQLDTTGGRIGIDWGKVSNKATSNDLSGTTVALVSGNVNGNVAGSVGSVAGNVAGSVASVSGNVGGSVASVTGYCNLIAPTALQAFGILGSTATHDGTTTTLRDTTNLTQTSSSHWLGSMIVMTGGTCAGQSARVTGFNTSTDTLTFAPALTTAVLTGDTFCLVPAGVAGAIQDAIAGAITTSLATANSGISDLQGRTPNALVGGFMKASVQGFDSTVRAALVTAIQDTVMTEGYAANGATMSLAQACYMLFSALTEFSIAAGIVTAKKLDGTPAMTFAWDSPTTPTSSERQT